MKKEKLFTSFDYDWKGNKKRAAAFFLTILKYILAIVCFISVPVGIFLGDRATNPAVNNNPDFYNVPNDTTNLGGNTNSGSNNNTNSGSNSNTGSGSSNTEQLLLYYSRNGCMVTGVQDQNLTSIEIPSFVTSIGTEAFKGCSSLESVTIPDSMTSIGQDAFSDCPASIVWGDNPTITTIGSYAFRGYNGTSITIPDSVTSIGKSAFYYCTSLTSVTIPNSVTSIGDYAFQNCTSFTSVTIPDSVTSIGNGAFSGCTSLTSITYQGTQTQWNAISKGSSWNNNTGSYKVYCTDGTINQ